MDPRVPISRLLRAVDQGIAKETDKMAEQQLTENLRGQCRADALWIVWRAKERDGRGQEPPTSHDADVMHVITDLLLLVSGQIKGPHPQVRMKEEANQASASLPSTKGDVTAKLDGIVEELHQAAAQAGNPRMDPSIAGHLQVTHGAEPPSPANQLP